MNGKLLKLRMARRKCIGSSFSERKNQRTVNVCQRLHRFKLKIDLPRKAYCSLCTHTDYRLIYHERHSVVCVPILPITVQIQSVVVHLVRMGFQGCIVYCLLPPTMVYFAVLQPGLFSVHCLIHCTATRTTFIELPHALC